MTDQATIGARLAALPRIRRARLWRLYTQSLPSGESRRYLDFWMDGGSSLLGAKGTGIGTAAKAAIDMGLTRPFPSALEARFAKALLAAFPAWGAVRLFRSEERALAAAEARSHNAPIARPRPFGEHLAQAPEPWRRAAAWGASPDSLLSGSAATTAGATKPAVALPLLPCPPAFAPSVLLFASAEDARSQSGDIVPPLWLGAAHRGLVELARFERAYNEELWRRADRRLDPHFARRGPFLLPRCEAEEYGAFFAAALAAGALLSPAYEEPSILPGDFDDGELAHLATALAAARG